MFKRNLIFMLCLAGLTACTGVPEGITIVQGIQADRYLGMWYEIARLDHSFERDLQKVTADYRPAKDGSIRVINKGYNPIKKTWESAEGKAYFIEAASTNHQHSGRLKVSFFGPFYSSYNIIDLDTKHYQYAMICGPTKSYFWILSRTPTLNQALLAHQLKKAKALGFAVEDLIYVKH